MGKILNIIKNTSLKSKLFMSIFALATIVPGVILAWGPGRPTFTMEKPAPYVTFNSITNAKGKFFSGDERNFVLVREEGGSWANEVNLQPGKTYEVFNYYHNNASTTLNDEAHGFAGIAKNTRMKVNVPATVKTGEKAQFLATVSADNANPTAVWDQAYGTNTSGANMSLSIIGGSAKIHNSGAINGASMPNELFSTGTNLGFDALDGKVPGCLPYAGYVSYKVKVGQPNFEMNKKVSKAGQNNWKEDIAVAPGEKVDYLIEYKNTGSTTQKNVVVKDTLPKGMTYVNGTTQLANAGNNFKPTAIADGVTTAGVNIGTYAPGTNATLRFSAIAPPKEQIAECGKDVKFTNTASVITENGEKSDTADITTNKDCEVVQPTLTCDLITITKISRNEFEFDTKYSVSNTEFTGTKYVIKDASGKVVIDKTVANGTKLKFTSGQNGKFSVTSTILTKNGNATSAKCSGSFEVKEEEKPGVSINKTVNGKENIEIAVNTEFTYELVVKNTGNVDLKNAIVTDKAPENVKFISADKGEIKDNAFNYTIADLKVGSSETIKIKAKATKSGTSAKNTACVDTPTIPGNPDDCDDATITTPEDKPSIKIEKTANGQNSISIGKDKEFNYEIKVTNTGDSDIKNAIVTDKAPENVQFISSSAGEIKDNVWTTTIVTLKPGESETFTIKAKVTKEDVKTKNTACVDTPTIPGNPDDCDEAEVEVPGVPVQPPVTPPVTPPTTPVIPEELPTTGPEQMLSAVAGMGSLTAAAGYYISSRKKL